MNKMNNLKSNNKGFDKNKLMEDYEGLFWTLIMNNYAENKGRELLKENEELKNDPQYQQYQPSDEAIKKLRKSLYKASRKKKIGNLMRKSIKILNRAGVIVAAFAIVFVILYTSVSAFRAQVLNFLVNSTDKYTTIRLSGSTHKTEIDVTDMLHNIYAPTYIPDGYWIHGFSNQQDIKTIEYINDEEKTICFSENTFPFSGNIDTENAELVKSVLINGIKGIFSFKNEISVISWENDGRVFMIYAQLSEEEIVKIAENVVFIK